jgi:hypothetical protein
MYSSKKNRRKGGGFSPRFCWRNRTGSGMDGDTGKEPEHALKNIKIEAGFPGSGSY